MRQHPLGIYEKALSKDLSWPERLVLAKLLYWLFDSAGLVHRREHQGSTTLSQV